MARPSHAHFMKRAIALALQAKGRTSPNPMVGCVIARQGRILAEGFHVTAGAHHAEVVALKKMGRGEAKGATLYVTMEPCSIQGKTPPCVPVVIESGIQRVVVGARDPNPLVDGGGIRGLKKAGLEVIESVLQEECENLNRPFKKFITTKMPYVTLKTALSLDGKVALASGESKWISSAKSREFVHELREEVDAIVVGSGTLKIDDPLLTCRLPNRKKTTQPVVVVIDPFLETPQNRRLFTVKNRKIIFATSELAPRENRQWLGKQAIEVLTFASDLTGRFSIRELLKALGQRGIMHLLVEGGAAVFSSFIAERQVDRVLAFLAPKILGGQGLDWLPELNIRRMKEALLLDPISVRQLGKDILVEGVLKDVHRNY